MKNADAGAVWMLAAMTGDSLLRHGRLPYIRNFKLMQQGGHGDRNRGAALGQYYLSKKGAFVEEWGNHIEPIGITYYTLIDIGNILLFEPQDTLLREKLREGADLLLSLQHPDGGFDVAYDKLTGKALFTDLEDLRPTFYGLLVAHRILGELEIPRCGAPRRRLVCRARRRSGTVPGCLRRRPFHQRLRHRAKCPGTARNIQSERKRTLSRRSRPRGAALRLLRIHPPAVGECTRPAEGPGTARLAAEPDGALLRTRRKHGIGDQERSHPANEPLAGSTPGWRQ